MISIGVINTQLMAVFERTHEFGLLRALGFEAHVLPGYQAGDNVGYTAALAGLTPAAAPATFLDLSTELFSDSRQSLNAGIGRLSASYASQNLVLELGPGFGPSGTEFGGRETSAGSGVFLRVPASVGGEGYPLFLGGAPCR